LPPIKVSLAAQGPSPIEIRDQVELCFELKSTNSYYLWRFFVLPNSTNPIILGLDWLETTDFVIDLKLKALKLNPNQEVPDNLEEPSPLYLLHNGSIFPNSMARVSVRSKNIESQNCVITSSQIFIKNLPNLVFANNISLITNHTGKTFITNPFPYPIKLRARTAIAVGEPMESPMNVTHIPENSQNGPKEINHISQTPHAPEIDPDIETLQLTDNLSETQKTTLRQLLSRYRKAFAFKPEELGKTHLASHDIDTQNNPPVRQPPYRVSQFERAEISKEVQKMLDLGVIVPSVSPYASPVVLVSKPDGTWRFCIDYRKLNKITKVDVYPMPQMDDALDKLSGLKYASSLDLMSWYYQVPLTP
jgi:hypothetical protein